MMSLSGSSGGDVREQTERPEVTNTVVCVNGQLTPDNDSSTRDLVVENGSMGERENGSMGERGNSSMGKQENGSTGERRNGSTDERENGSTGEQGNDSMTKRDSMTELGITNQHSDGGEFGIAGHGNGISTEPNHDRTEIGEHKMFFTSDRLCLLHKQVNCYQQKLREMEEEVRERSHCVLYSNFHFSLSVVTTPDEDTAHG